MVRYIVASFALMGWGFYELSGGSDFEPAQWRDIKAPTVETETLTVAETAIVETQHEAVAARLEAPKVDAASMVVLASVPTTRRLVGEAAPTPTTEKVILRPENPVIAEAVETPSFDATVTRASLTFEMNTDFRRVTGNRVNMRNGPGTNYSVVGKLVRDDEVEVLQDPGIGWVKLQVLETGEIGWMSAKLLTKPKT